MLNWSVVRVLFVILINSIFTIVPSAVLAGQVSLTWNLNTEPDIFAYNLYFGTQSGTYDAPGSPIRIEHPQDVFTLTELQNDQKYFFALTAVDHSGNESVPTSEISATAKNSPSSLDTTPPSISLTTPSQGSTVAGLVFVSASVSDDTGVIGVQFQLDGINLGSEDTTNEWGVSWDTTTVAPGTYTLRAIARDAANNTTFSDPVTVNVDPFSALTITNIQVENNKQYQIVDQGLILGARVYIDRTYTFTSIPEMQTEATFIQTANGDKNSSNFSWMSFEVNQPVTVYVAHDPRITTKPDWMASFTNTGQVLRTTDTSLELWSQSFAAGPVVLGGNRGSSGSASMYSVAIVGQGHPPADTTPPSAPVIQAAFADSDTQATISWTAATDNVDVTGYTLYRDNTPITTTSNLSFVDGNLSPNTTYDYYVVAHDDAENNSAPSLHTTVTTLAPPDTTLPTVTLTTPIVGETISGMVIVTATATDNVSVVGVQFQLDGVDLGEEDTTNTYSVAWDTSDTLSGNHTLTAIARDAAGNTSTSAPVVVSIDNVGIIKEEVEITKLKVESGKTYVVQKSINSGQTVYIDRSYTFTTIPSALAEATYLQTANGDKNSSKSSWLSFEVNQPVTVYVAHDPRITNKPHWMATFTNTGQVLHTTDTSLELWSQSFAAGPVVLGGNRGSSGSASMYSVAIVGQGHPPADTTPPTAPEIQSALADSETQTTITWSAATDNVGVTGYTLYRDNTILTTISNLTYVDTNLSPLTTYTYAVVAKDAAQNVSVPSSSVSVTTLSDSISEPPDAPTIQTVEATSDSQMQIHWVSAMEKVLAGVEGTVNLGANSYCPALPQPDTTQDIFHIASGDVNDLMEKISSAQPNTTILLADGLYPLQSNQTLDIHTQGMTIRGASGNRAAVKITGGHNNITVHVDNFTVADVTLSQPKYHNIQVRGEFGITGTKIYNVHMLDAGQQFVKVSAGDGMQGKFADNGLIACNRIEYTTFSKGTDITPPSYTNGVDVLAGKGWVIRDNEFRRIRSEAGPAGPAILVWKNSIDTIIRRNLIVDSWRGIALGLNAPNHISRGGASVIYDHQNGLVENNVILALHEPADAAIENNYALNSQVRHNTIFYNEDLPHTVHWSMEYRFEPTTVTFSSNLTNFPIIARSPFPDQEAIRDGNLTDAKADWFNDIMAEQYHLTQSSGKTEATSFTLYRNGIPVGTTASLSYEDSNLMPSTTYSYTVTALNEAGNESVPSAPVSGTTLALPDTSNPQVSITAPEEGTTVSGIVTVSATATDNIGVVGVQFFLDGIDLGPEDTTNHFSTSWDTTGLTPGIYTLTAVARDAEGNTTNSTPVNVNIEAEPNANELEISNLVVENGKTYVVVPNGLTTGAVSYIDRSYSFTTIPTALQGATYLRTANNDKNSTSSTFLSFDVNQTVTVYIAHDDRISTKPSWLQGFTRTGEVLHTSDTDLELWSKSFSAGHVSLGGNRGSGEGASMFSVVVTPSSSGLPLETLVPQPQGSALLQWQKNQEPDLSYYKVYYGTQSQVYSTSMNVGLTSTPDAPQYLVTNLPPGTYYFAVTAVDTSGNESPYSTEGQKVILN